MNQIGKDIIPALEVSHGIIILIRIHGNAFTCNHLQHRVLCAVKVAGKPYVFNISPPGQLLKAEGLGYLGTLHLIRLRLVLGVDYGDVGGYELFKINGDVMLSKGWTKYDVYTKSNKK